MQDGVMAKATAFFEVRDFDGLWTRLAPAG